MRRCVVLAVMLALAVPHAAHAGTASIGIVRVDYKYPYDAPSLQFRSAPGERNQIVVTRGSAAGAPVWMLHDDGAAVTAAGGCTAVDEHTASCPASVSYFDVDVGDGDDSVTLAPALAGPGGAYVRGGAGSDVLSGAGFLAGGPGHDVLTCTEPCSDSVLAGGAGADRLIGGSGDDLLSGDGDGPPQLIPYEHRLTESGGAGSDSIDGGPGRDTLTFRGRAASVTVDLGAAKAAGGAGESDRLAGIEDVQGGDGDDLLIGDGAANVLQGDGGDDRIDGRAGDDYLLGNLVPVDNEFGLGHTPPDPGADTLRGGEGNDRLDAGGERGDRLFGGSGDDVLQDGLGSFTGTYARMVRCGSGRDMIDFAPRGQLMSDCELLRLYSKAQIALRPQRRTRGRLRFTWTCSKVDGCAMALGVRVRSSPIARRALQTQGSARRAFYLRTRPGSRRGDIADITVIVPTGNPDPSAARWRVKL